jgi:tetratricopeptide (TPR) repeat protein
VLDAGIPFSFTTPEVTSSHLQAVIGYDDVRNTLIIRDPGERHQIEMIAEGLERYRSSGPRGLAMVPIKDKHRLEGLTLPDTELFDQIFRMERALEAHDRTRAESIYRALSASSPGHRLTLLAERILAGYDADSVRQLAVIEKLLELYPDDLRLHFSKTFSLRDLARHSEYVEVLDKLSNQPVTDPAFWEQFAQELAGDARTYAEAERWLKRTIRANPSSARAFNLLAGVCWSRRHFDDAVDLSRLAACMEETSEYLARNYFENANLAGRREEALEFLRRRFERLGKKSGQPAQTLAWAYLELERTSEAYALYERAMAQRPDDGDLALAVVDQYVQHGKFAEARKLAARTRRKSHRGGWLRSVATLESAQGNLTKARQLWARVLAMQPLAEDAHRAFALLLAETQGRDATLEHLRGVCARFPHHFRLTQLLMDWLQEDGPEAVEPIIRKLIDLHPNDAWARRQLALNLAEQNRLEEAFMSLAEAEPLEPGSIGYHGVRGVLLKQAGRFEEAKEDLRAVVRISVDATYAMNELIGICEPDERRAEMAFLQAELTKQVTNGNGLLAFRDLATGTMEPEELLRSLQKMKEARADLWHTWAAVIRQLRFMEELDEALALARTALERFPLVPDLWVDLADVHEANLNEEGAIEALKTAHEINSYWAHPLQRLSDLYGRRDEFDKAKRLIEAAIARAPLKAENHAILARFLWNSGKRHDGFERMRHTVDLDPGLESAWDDLCGWAAELGCYHAVVDIAREQTAKRPGEIRSWMRLAQALHAIPGEALCDDPERQEECLAAIDRVLQLRPWLVEAHDLKAQVLAEAERWVEAQEACDAPVWRGRPPVLLRGRLAWIIYMRGDAEEAIKLMSEACKLDPEYYWGWRNLADWHEQLGQHDQLLQVTEKLIGFDPYNPANYVRRAEAKRALEDRDGAKADYERAVELAPDYHYPLFQLFDMHVEDGDTEAARALLDRADPTQARGDFLLRSLQLANIEEDTDTAIAALEDLCGAGDEGQIESAVELLEQAGLQAEAEDVLHRYLGEGDSVCKQWIALLVRKSSLEDVRPRIESLPPKHLCRLNVTVAYSDALADAGMNEQLADWVRANESLLRKKTWAWGQIGSHFSRILDDERTSAWMHDWKERKGVQPWMLMNLSLAVRGLDRFADGAVINRHVLENYESDYTSLFHRTWLMLDDALADNAEAVAQFFHDHALSELDPNHRWVAALGRGILMCLSSDDRAQTLQDVHDMLTESAEESEPIDRDQIFRLVYEKCIRHMAEICGDAEWEAEHLGTPIFPPLKPKPGEESLEEAELLEEVDDLLAELDGDEDEDFDEPIEIG